MAGGKEWESPRRELTPEQKQNSPQAGERLRGLPDRQPEKSPLKPSEEVVETLDPEVEDAIRAYAMGDPEEEAQLREQAKTDPGLRRALLHPGGGLAYGPPPFDWGPKEDGN